MKRELKTKPHRSILVGGEGNIVWWEHDRHITVFYRSAGGRTVCHVRIPRRQLADWIARTE